MRACTHVSMCACECVCVCVCACARACVCVQCIYILLYSYLKAYIRRDCWYCHYTLVRKENFRRHSRSGKIKTLLSYM